MGIFGPSKQEKMRIDTLRKVNGQKSRQIEELKKSNGQKNERIEQLENLCEEKDDYFKELMSDGLKHGSSLAAKHMSDRKKDLKGK